MVCSALGRDTVLVMATAFGATKFSRAKHHVLDDHLVGGYIGLGLDHGDAGIRCGLAGNRDIGVLDGDVLAAHVNDTTHFEHNDAWPLCLHGCAVGPSARFIKICNANDAASAPPKGALGPALTIVGVWVHLGLGVRQAKDQV